MLGIGADKLLHFGVCFLVNFMIATVMPSQVTNGVGFSVGLSLGKDDVTIRDAIGRNQTMTAINESGLYSLILSSKMPNAKKFKRWVTSEVLPAIRKHGLYATDDLIANPDLAIAAFTALKEEREKNKEDKGLEELYREYLEDLLS